VQSDMDRHKATIWDHLALLLKWRKLVIVFMTLMAISSVTYSIMVKKWYFSDARILPPPATMMSLGGMLPNLDLGLLGDMTGMDTESKLIVAVLESRRMMDKVIDKFEWSKVYKYNYKEKAYKHYMKNVIWEISEEGSFYIRVNDIAPQRAAETINYIVDELAAEYNNITVAQARSQRMFIEKRLNQNLEDLKNAEDRMEAFQSETGAIALEDQLRSTIQAIATIKTEQILADVQLEVFEKTLPENSSMVIQAREQSRALAAQVNKLIRKSDEKVPSVLIGLDIAPQIGVEYWRLFREIELQAKILEFLLPQYEQAKISELKEKGDLYILDSGVIPEKKFKPKRALIVLAWMFISFVFLYMYIAFIEWLHRLKDIDQNRYELVNGVLKGLLPANLFNWSKPDDSSGDKR